MELAAQRTKTAADAALLAALYAACYQSTIRGMVPRWLTEDYSYALLLPFIAGYLMWERRRDLAQAPLRPWWPGLMLLLLALACSLYSLLGSDLSGARISAWLMLCALVLLCAGLRVGRLVALPLVLLGFMIPAPEAVAGPLTATLKLLSSKLAVGMMRLAGMTVFLEGNVIDLGTNRLQVVDACSGLRYLFPLVALGLVAAHFLQRRRWKQAILVAATLPLAVVMNGLRVGLTGILSEFFSPQLAQGFFHGFSGWLLFVVATAALLFLNRLLGRPGGGGPTGSEVRPPAQGPSGSLPTGPFLAAGLALLILAMATLSTRAMPALALPGGLGAFPLQFSGWQGVASPVDPEIVAQSGAEESFQAVYGRQSQAVSLYMGWRGSPFLESEEFFHSPTVCLPAGGWQVIEERTRLVGGAPGGLARFAVTEMLVEKLGERQLVYFWFQTRRGASPSIFRNRVGLALAALRRESTYDVFVRLITPAGSGKDAAEARLDGFLREVEVPLVRFLGEARPRRAT